jgi:hypothetical protein
VVIFQRREFGHIQLLREQFGQWIFAGPAKTACSQARHQTIVNHEDMGGRLVALVGHPLAQRRDAGIRSRSWDSGVDDGIWLVSFMHYDLGYIDLEQRTLQTIDNPFGTRLSPMS